MYCHLSVVSFQSNSTFAEEPRSTSIPAFTVGADAWPIAALSVIMLSAINAVVVFAYTVCPTIV